MSGKRCLPVVEFEGHPIRDRVAVRVTRLMKKLCHTSDPRQRVELEASIRELNLRDVDEDVLRARAACW